MRTIMFVPKLLFYVSVLSTSQITLARTGRSCFDCVSIYSCESGLDFVRKLRNGTLSPENRKITLNSFCGFERVGKIPKVCCSDFPMNEQPFIPPTPPPTPPPTSPPTSPPTLTKRIGVGLRSGSADPIEDHRNIGLLPTFCGNIDGSRIFNGEIAKLYEFPWMALIAYNTAKGREFLCGGSVINSRYILTAAHCVIEKGQLKNIAGVRVGEHDYTTAIDCQGSFDEKICESKIQDFLVEDIIPHDRFTGRQPIEADIALLRVKKEINITNNAAPVCLPVYSNLRNSNLAGKNATVAGWGLTEKGETSKLMKVVIPILTGDACDHYYSSYGLQGSSIMDTAFCAGEQLKDSCRGDSGGPLMMESDYNGSIRQVEFGIVSHGPQKCGSESPGVYTDVTKYMEWILDNMRE